MPRVLDLGCGPGLTLDHIAASSDRRPTDYHAINISARMIDLARARWPDAQLKVRDIIADPLPPLSVDYVVMNGVLTLKHDLPREQVDPARDDLFHRSFDEVASFLVAESTRHIAFRSDYGLYELSAFASHAS